MVETTCSCPLKGREEGRGCSPHRPTVQRSVLNAVFSDVKNSDCWKASRMEFQNSCLGTSRELSSPNSSMCLLCHVTRSSTSPREAPTFHSPQQENTRIQQVWGSGARTKLPRFGTSCSEHLPKNYYCVVFFLPKYHIFTVQNLRKK